MGSHWRVLSRGEGVESSLSALLRRTGRQQEWKYENQLEDAFVVVQTRDNNGLDYSDVRDDEKLDLGCILKLEST